MGEFIFADIFAFLVFVAVLTIVIVLMYKVYVDKKTKHCEKGGEEKK